MPQSRAITAGGFVDGAPVVFEDFTKAAGLDKFHHRSGTPEKETILETIGSGVAFLDYDNDGWLDIYLVNRSTFPALNGKGPALRAALFHNNHDGTFSDVTDYAEVANERWGFGVAAGDYDNDGWPDIYVANFGKNRLYHNNHDGTFADVAEEAGVALGGWSAGPTWGDYDRVLSDRTMVDFESQLAGVAGMLVSSLANLSGLNWGSATISFSLAFLWLSRPSIWD